MRPSHKEILGKIALARAALHNSGYLPAEPQKLAVNFYELDLFTVNEQMECLVAALNEICPEDYKGARPPEKSYEKATTGSDLFPFHWSSIHFKKQMYFKFCLQSDNKSSQPALFVFSLHEDRPKPKRSAR